MSENKREVFISYRRSDNANNYVEKLHKSLEEILGKGVFFDQKDLWKWSKDGFPLDLRNAIDNCYCFLCIVSQDYLTLREGVDWCEEELKHAKERHVPVVAIVLDNATETGDFKRINPEGSNHCRTDGKEPSEHDKLISWLKSKTAEFSVGFDTSSESVDENNLRRIVELIFNTMFLDGQRTSFDEFLNKQTFTKEDVGESVNEDIKDWITFKIKKQKTNEEIAKEAELTGKRPSEIVPDTGEYDMDGFRESLGKEKRVVITGDAGQGKSIYLKQLCNKLSKVLLERQYSRNELFPIYAELKRIDGCLTADNDIIDAIAKATQNGMTKEMIKCVVRNGMPCFLFDGIDEISPERFIAIKALLENCDDLIKENVRMVFTSRPGQQWIANNADVTMKSVVGNCAQDVIVRRWKLDAISDEIFEVFAEQVFNNTECANKKSNEATAKGFVEALKEKEINDEKYVAISRNSFMLKMSALIFKTRNSLPNTKIEAFDRAVNDIVKRELSREKTPDSGLADNVKQVLGEIAYNIYQNRDDDTSNFVLDDYSIEQVIREQFIANSDVNRLIDFFRDHKLIDENGFAHELFACYYCAFYIYRKMLLENSVGNGFKGTSLYSDELQHAKENIKKEYWKGVVEMLICLVEFNARKLNKRIYQELLDTMLTSMQTEVKDPDYDLLCEAVVQFIDKENRALAEKNLILGMLERGERGIKTFDTETYTCSDGANPYDELFYFVAWYDLFSGLKNIFDERNNCPLSPIQIHLFNELCEVLGQKLMIPKGEIEEKYESIFSSAAFAYRDNARGHAIIDIDSILPLGYLPIFITTSIKIIGNSDFSTPAHCSEVLKYIFVESDRYSVVDNCIMDNETGELILASARTISIPKSTLSIGTNAFSYCQSIKEILIPQSVESIDENAFEYCNSLESLQVDENNERYYSDGNCVIERATETLVLGCKNSRIPNTVKSIDRAFYGCTLLREVAIPSNVEFIDEDAFYDCHNIIHINVENDNHCYLSKNDCLIEKETGTLLLGCNNSVIPTTGDVKIIGDNAFENCSKLIEVKIPKDVYSIGFGAFARCTSLKKVTFEADSCLRIICDCAFCDCGQLESIEIPDSTTIIEGQAFYGCGKLKNIKFPKKLQQIGGGAIDDTEWMCEQNGYTYINRILYGYKKSKEHKHELIVLKDDCIAINEGVFSDAHDLESILIPSSVEKIGLLSFKNCENLRNIIFLGNSELKTIGDFAFSGCRSLNSFSVPDNVEEIGTGAFSDCFSLEQVHFGKNSKLLSISEDAFSGTPWRENLPNGIVYFGPIASDIKGLLKTGSTIVIKAGTKAVTRKVLSEIDWIDFVFPNSLIKVDGTELHKTDWFNNHPEGLVYVGHVVCGYNGDFVNAKDIELPNTTKGISSFAFMHTSRLRSISMKDGVEYIGESAFFNSALESIKMSDNIEKICDSTFYRCIKLKSIILPKNTNLIGGFAFSTCVDLAWIVIYNRLETVEYNAFYNCFGLKRIYYIGTKEQWNEMKVGQGNDCLLKAKRYYYSENEPIGVENIGEFWHFAEDGKTPIVWGE